MATVTLNDYAVTGAWTNLAATLTAAASVNVVVQNISTGIVQVFFGGASAPTGSGFQLAPSDSIQGNAAQIWVRGPDGNETVSVMVI